MSQDNQFHQYGYDHYLKAPRKNRSKSGGGIGSRIMESLQSPLVATGALLITGVVFATIIVLAYPSADDQTREIPIVRADLRPMKSVPDEDVATAEVPNSDNTVLANIGQPRTEQNVVQVENLLAPPSEEDFVSKEQALEQAMAEESPNKDVVGQALSENVTPTLIEEAKKLESEKSPEGATAVPQVAVQDVTPVRDPSNVMQKIENTPIAAVGEEIPQDDPSAIAQVVEETVADAKIDTGTEDKPTMHAAATSPETIDFVRTALKEDNSDVHEAAPPASVEESPVSEEPVVAQKADVKPVKSIAEKVIEEDVVLKKAKEANKITPAAGAASPSINIQSGSYFVQLASITDRSRSDKEYIKLQKKFAVLKGIDFRVQEASLDKGMFYRIQAGPMSKDSAKQVCEEIKKQKPGGCIVTK